MGLTIKKSIELSTIIKLSVKRIAHMQIIVVFIVYTD